MDVRVDPLQVFEDPGWPRLLLADEHGARSLMDLVGHAPSFVLCQTELGRKKLYEFFRRCGWPCSAGIFVARHLGDLGLTPCHEVHFMTVVA